MSTCTQTDTRHPQAASKPRLLPRHWIPEVLSSNRHNVGASQESAYFANIPELMDLQAHRKSMRASPTRSTRQTHPSKLAVPVFSSERCYIGAGLRRCLRFSMLLFLSCVGELECLSTSSLPIGAGQCWHRQLGRAVGQGRNNRE